MGVNKLNVIEVAYAKPHRQKILRTEVKLGETIEAAIRRSGILEMFPEIDLKTQKVGIFGKVKKLSDRVKEGDRVEIYRELTIDPKEARRVKAKRK